MATATAPKVTPLNDSQVLILQALAKCEVGTGLNKVALAKTGAAINCGNLGPVFKQVLANYPDSLYGLGLVKPTQHPDEELVWEATAKGRAVADRYRARKVTGGAKVPGAVLDPVVKKFLPTRTYGLELYTDDDLKEIRALLGDDFATLPLTALRQQIVNRRKQGAFSSKEDRTRASVTRALKEFGTNGTVVDGLLTDAQIERLEGLLGLDTAN